MKLHMNPNVCTMFILVLLTACTPFSEISTQSVATNTNSPTPSPARIEIGEITSQALANNLLGDPSTRKYGVALPPGYDTSNQRYPVVYVLHWYPGSYITHLYTKAAALKLLIDNGKVKPMILVFPDASNKLGGSMYASSPTIGDYETYITKELVQKIDTTYRTLADRESRGVMGCSMGGMGTFHLAFKYPDIFGVAAPMSGIVGSEDFAFWELTRSEWTHEPKNMNDFDMLPVEERFLIAEVAVAAPNPDKPPFYLDMPFELVDGKAQIVPEVFDKMTSLKLMNDVTHYLAQPIRLRGLLIYTDTDKGDTPDWATLTLDDNRRLDKDLTNLGIDHQYTEIDASHCMFDFSPILEFMDANLVH